MFKVILYAFFLLISILLIFIWQVEELGYAIIGWFVIGLINKVLENHSNLFLWLKCNSIYKSKDIRISISYLFRIKVKGKYLLVRGERIKRQFQPVGGVYKVLPEAIETFNKLRIKDDDCIPIDDNSENDLRLRVKGENIPKFLKWYNSGRQREVSVFREFYEELIRTGILERDIFPYINYRHIYRKQTDIRFSDYFNCYEILIAEVFELIPDKQQEKELIKLMVEQENQKYIWVDEKTIRSRGVSTEHLDQFISKTSQWII